MPSTRDFAEAETNRLLAASEAYYHGTPTLTDEEFDSAFEKLVALAQNSLGLQEVIQPLLNIGHGAKAGDVKHRVPMQSLRKVHAEPELQASLKKLGDDWVITPKLDGLALAVRYRYGKLKEILTRGDGSQGKDVTRCADILQVPKVIKQQGFLEFRGEAVLSKASFEKLQADATAEGREAFANPRNAVSGLINAETRRLSAPVDFIVYSTIGENSTIPFTVFQGLQDSIFPGFNLVDDLGLYINCDITYDSLSEKYAAFQAASDYETDGLVITCSRKFRREELGVGSRYPHYSFAVKFAGESAIATVEAINLDVGRTGKITFTAQITPTEIDGSTVEFASVHNMDFIAQEGIGVGAQVDLVKAGDIIPRITGGVGGAPYVAPTQCPKCDGNLVKNGPDLFCQGLDCNLLPRLVYAAGRDALDIRGLSEAHISSMLKTSRTIENVLDFYIATCNLAFMKNTISENNGAKLAHLSCEKVGNVTIDRVLIACGIPGTGRTMCRRIADAFNNDSSELLRGIMDLTVYDWPAIEGLGPKKLKAIDSWMRDNGDMIGALLLTLEPVSRHADAPTGITSALLSGKKVVVSGAIPGMTREDVKAALEAAGAKPSSSISGKTDIFVMGEGGSDAKLIKSVELGIENWTPVTLLAELNG